jgi:predicted RNase H-like HicB family nuclease
MPCWPRKALDRLAVAETREEVEELIKGASAMQPEGRREDGVPIPEPTVAAAAVQAA